MYILSPKSAKVSISGLKRPVAPVVIAKTTFCCLTDCFGGVKFDRNIPFSVIFGLFHMPRVLLSQFGVGLVCIMASEHPTM